MDERITDRLLLCFTFLFFLLCPCVQLPPEFRRIFGGGTLGLQIAARTTHKRNLDKAIGTSLSEKKCFSNDVLATQT